MLKLENKNLEKTIQAILNKSITEIEEKDLDTIEVITLDGNSFWGKENNLEDLKKFRSLKKIILKNYYICEKNYKNLEELQTIKILELFNCDINSNIIIKLKLKKIIFDSCNNMNIGNFLKNSKINEIYIRDCRKINLQNLNYINNTEEISFEEIEIKRKMLIDLCNSNIKNINFNNCYVGLFIENMLEKLNKLKNINCNNKKLVK